ncbi:hypothetical protein PFHG_04990, partial [Plasmodium falciparum HB3]
MAVASGGGEDGIDKRSAKHLLDSIGKIVHDEIVEKAEAQTYKEALKGDLQHATNINPELIDNIETCDLVYKYYKHTNGGDARGKRYPCENLSGKYVERFSDTLGGQCTNEKIKGNKYIERQDVGACAPYRRLHLCSHNLEKMEANNYDSGNAKHNLLVDVCMAAKYEGDSIKNYYPKYQRTYGDSPSQICTMLARSFADIGDIVRGKDLFYGNPQEKEQREKLDEKLKEIFKKIHDNLVEKKGNEAKDRYKDEPDNNFYQLREDWWMANRDQVWKAITCKADNSNRYFRQTCGSGEKGSATTGKCRCSDKPKSGKPGD